MRKGMTLLTGLLLTLSFAAHAGGKDVSIYQRTDEFKGSTIYFTENSQAQLEGGSFWSGRYVDFSFKAISPFTDADNAYIVAVDAMLEDWLFISHGESLILKADDQIVTLHGDGSADSREVIDGNTVTESAWYTISLATLRKLASAQKITFRIYGDRGQITGTFSDRLMAELRFFAMQAPSLIKDPAGGPAPAPGASWPQSAAAPAIPSPTTAPAAAPAATH